MGLGKWLNDLIGNGPALQPIPVRALTQQQLMAQRQQLMERAMTPERQERIGQAFQAQAARQQIDRQLRDTLGAMNLTDVMRSKMGEK